MHIWHYVSESIGMLQGLAVLFPEDDLRQILVVDLFPKLVQLRQLCVDTMREADLASDEAETTRTRSGVRDVKLLGPALEALQAQNYIRLMKTGALFENPRTGEAWTGDQPIRRGAWVPAMRKAGIRYRRPYQSRHPYASMMLSAGESPMWVAQQIGHSDWTMIARIYGRWIPEAAPDGGQRR